MIILYFSQHPSHTSPIDTGIRGLSEHALRTVNQPSLLPNQFALFPQQLSLQIRLPPLLIDLDITPLPQRPLHLRVPLPLASHLNIVLLLVPQTLRSRFPRLLTG